MIRLFATLIALAGAFAAPAHAASLSQDVWNSVLSDCLDQAEKEFPDLFNGTGAKVDISREEDGPSKSIPVKVINACNSCLAKRIDAEFSANDAVEFERGATTDGMVPADLLDKIAKMRRECVRKSRLIRVYNKTAPARWLPPAACSRVAGHCAIA